jgi:hypothetical protein
LRKFFIRGTITHQSFIMYSKYWCRFQIPDSIPDGPRSTPHTTHHTNTTHHTTPHTTHHTPHTTHHTPHTTHHTPHTTHHTPHTTHHTPHSTNCFCLILVVQKRPRRTGPIAMWGWTTAPSKTVSKTRGSAKKKETQFLLE